MRFAPLLILGSLVASSRAAPQRTPADPAAPLVDARAPTWGGDVGTLGELRWLRITGHTAIHAYRAGYIERDTVIVIRRVASGLEWAAITSDGPVSVTEDRLVGSRVVLRADAGVAHVTRSSEPISVALSPVPASALADLALAFDHVPIPGVPTKPSWQDLSIEVSTAKAHVVASVPGAIGPMHALLGQPAGPAGPSRDLRELAERISNLVAR